MTGQLHRLTAVRQHVPRRLADHKDVLAVHAYVNLAAPPGSSPERKAQVEQLVNERRFFYAAGSDAYPEQRLYIPVHVRVAYGFSWHLTDHAAYARQPRRTDQQKILEYPELTELILAMERQRTAGTNQPDERGVMLLSRSGSGKTVASLKAFYDTLFHSASDETSTAGIRPALSQFLPVWLTVIESVDYEQIKSPAERIALLILAAQGLIDLRNCDPVKREQRLRQLRWWMQYGPRWLIFLDLNAVTSTQTQNALAEGLLAFQKEYGAAGHRCVVTFRSSDQRAGAMETLRAENEKWFGFYDLQPLSTDQGTGYFVASREFEVNVLNRELDVPLGDRDVEAESEKLRQLIEEAGTGPESIISTPLVMHLISQIQGQELRQVETLFDLYRAAVVAHWRRDWGHYREKLQEAGFKTEQEAFEAVVTAMVRVALKILHKSADDEIPAKTSADGRVHLAPHQESLRLPLDRVWELLQVPEFELDRRHSAFPQRPFWQQWRKRGTAEEQETALYYDREFSDEQIPRLIECSLFRWEEQSVGFLHDSFVYYFCGGPALVEYQRPGLGHNHLARLLDDWCQELEQWLIAEPDRWLLPGMFLGGAIAWYDRIKKPGDPLLHRVLRQILTAPSHGEWPFLVQRLVRGAGKLGLAQQVDKAIQWHPGYLRRVPQMLLQQAVNCCGLNGEPGAELVETWLNLWRQREDRNSTWLRYTKASPLSSAQTMWEHTGTVNCVAVTPDGYIVSGGEDGKVIRWHPETGQVDVMNQHQSRVTSVAVLPDGRIVSGSLDSTVKLWNPLIPLDQPDAVQSMDQHRSSIYSVAVLPDGRIVSGSRDSTVKLWDSLIPLNEPGAVKSMDQHQNWVHSVAVLPDGRIVSGSEDKTVKLWNPLIPLNEPGAVKSMDQHQNWVHSVAVLPDGRIVSGSWDSTVKLWNPLIPLDQSGAVQSINQHQRWVSTVCVVPSQFSLPDSATVQEFPLVCSTDDKGVVNVWNVTTGEVVPLLVPVPQRGEVMALAATCDHRLVTAFRQLVLVHNPWTREELLRLPLTANLSLLATHPTQPIVVYRTGEGWFQLDLRPGQPHQPLELWNWNFTYAALEQ